jgi:Kdo2-lipid IVA lauroyltransferase/acyltransferase
MAEAAETARLRGVPFGQRLAWRIEAIGASLLFGLFRALPLDAASALGGWLARTIGPRLGISKRAHFNLRRAMPELSEADRRRIVRGMWDNLGRIVAEYPHLGEFRIYEKSGRVEFVGEELVAPLLASGKQIIIASAHYGNWEIGTMAASQRGMPLAKIYRAANNPWVDRMIESFRHDAHTELLPKGAVAARGMIAALREGRHLALLVDQKMNDGIPVPFFGRDAMTAPAVAQLALRFDCTIIAARVERMKGASFRISLSAPMAIPRTGDRHADSLAVMTAINAEIERWIRARPDQWLWLHRRWPD